MICLGSAPIPPGNVNSNDTEMEPGLSALMEIPEANDVVGEALGRPTVWTGNSVKRGP